MELFDSKRQERMQAVIKEITASKENAIKFLKEAGSPHALIGLTYTSSAVYGNKLRFTTLYHYFPAGSTITYLL